MKSQRFGGFVGENLGVVPTSWQVVEEPAGDFSGSGQSGILWRNSNGDTELCLLLESEWLRRRAVWSATGPRRCSEQLVRAVPEEILHLDWATLALSFPRKREIQLILSNTCWMPAACCAGMRAGGGAATAPSGAA